ncbi:MAG TPA: ABC transporter permease [Tepidisphaeraceae bacterium]|jgi:ribose transport system permease protein
MTETLRQPSRVAPARPKQSSRGIGAVASVADQLGLLLVLILLIAAFGLTTRYFFTLDTFRTIANQIPSTVLVSVGMTYVLIIGGIDLSVGSVLGLSGAVIGVLMTRTQPAPVAVALLAAVGVGFLCGAVNGLVTVTWSIPSFVVTLGMLEIARGATHIVSKSQTAYIGGAVGGLADARFLGLSAPFWIAMTVVVIGQFILLRTVFGRYMIAIGTNEEAMRLSGIATRPVKVIVFMIAGLLAGAGAVMDVSRSQASNPNSGTSLELDVIAAVVIGGTSLMGGRGSVVNSLLGVAIIAILGAGLAAQNVRDETKRLITGFVIVLAVILDYYRHRFSAHRQGRD